MRPESVRLRHSRAYVTQGAYVMRPRVCRGENPRPGGVFILTERRAMARRYSDDMSSSSGSDSEERVDMRPVGTYTIERALEKEIVEVYDAEECPNTGNCPSCKRAGRTSWMCTDCGDRVVPHVRFSDGVDPSVKYDPTFYAINFHPYGADTELQCRHTMVETDPHGPVRAHSVRLEDFLLTRAPEEDAEGDRLGVEDAQGWRVKRWILTGQWEMIRRSHYNQFGDDMGYVDRMAEDCSMHYIRDKHWVPLGGRRLEARP